MRKGSGGQTSWRILAFKTTGPNGPGFFSSVNIGVALSACLMPRLSGMTHTHWPRLIARDVLRLVPSVAPSQTCGMFLEDAFLKFNLLSKQPSHAHL